MSNSVYFFCPVLYVKFLGKFGKKKKPIRKDSSILDQEQPPLCQQVPTKKNVKYVMNCPFLKVLLVKIVSLAFPSIMLIQAKSANYTATYYSIWNRNLQRTNTTTVNIL